MNVDKLKTLIDIRKQLTLYQLMLLSEVDEAIRNIKYDVEPVSEYGV